MRFVIAVFCFLLAVACAADLHTEAKENYSRLIRDVNPRNLKRSLESLYSSSRVGGCNFESSAGLGSIGAVRKESYLLTMADPHAKATLTIGSKTIELFPLWPNGIRTCTCNVSGKLIYARDGEISEFDGQEVAGSIVILDFNSGQNWLTAARLGAKAVIFLEPQTTTRAQGEAKWSAMPLNIPRFYALGDQLLSQVGKSVRISCRQPMIDRQVSNYYVAIPGTDSKMKNEWVVISAYCDSISVVPGLPHGADQSAGAAALFELARIFKETGCKRSVLILLTSGHFQAMQGMRNFIEQRFEHGWGVTGGKTPVGFFCLDLSTRTPSVAALAKGWWFDYRDENIQMQTSVARALREHVGDIAEVMREPEDQVFFDGVNNPDGRAWKNSVPGRYAIESEVATIAGLPAITFMSSNDARILQDTPFDTPDNVSIGNLTNQTRTLACMFWHLLNDTQDETVTNAFSIPYRGGKNLSRMSLMGGFGTVTGQILSYDPKKSFLPDVPLVGAIAETGNKYRAYMGVRGLQHYRAVGPKATYTIYGVPPVTAWPEDQRKPVGVFGYVLNDAGAIEEILDFGVRASQFGSLFEMTTSYRETPLVLFPCTSIELYGLVGPHELRSLTFLDILDARNNGMPQRFCYLAPFQMDFKLQSFVENSAVVFASPGTAVKILASTSMAGNSLLLTNSDEDTPAGHGFVLGKDAVANVALSAAKDTWNLNNWREKELLAHNIKSESLHQLQEKAAEDIKKAEDSYADKRYSDAERYARSGWGYALRAQPQFRKATSDILNGLIFYLALLLPFAYFSERLILASSSLAKQLLGSAAIFVMAFMLLRFLHPAFDLTGNSFMIFVAFTIGALSLVVITFIVGKFETGLQRLQQVSEGVHEERAGRISLAVTALAIGISNMRRRKARTALTCATLVLVTFIVLSFTSIVTDLRFNEVPAAGTPSYPGILLRNVTLDPIEESAYQSLKTEFKGNGVAVRRAWFFGAEIGAQSVLTFRRGDKAVHANALLGLDPDEANVTKPQNSLLAGRWFSKGALNEAILPLSVADQLNIVAADIGKATIEFAGIELRIVGIADDTKLKSIVDLDNEGLLPADFGLSQQLQDKGLGGDFAFRKYVRYDASTVCIVPAELAISLGADIRAVAVSFRSYEETQRAMQKIMPRTALNLYASVPGASGPENMKFSTIAATQGRGFELVVIPVIIAIVIVLNTMISSVLERTREIGIFSAVGLSPRHISALFFAESLVYAVLGSILGYFVAQIASVILHRSGAFSGISLNYSSLSAVFSTVIVVGVVLISTIYPARKAKQIATPAGGEEWQTESPAGDEWLIMLPFTVTRSHASALSKFYAEWFAAYEEYSIGDFVTEDVEAGKNGDMYFASARCWLAPYDLGIQQTLRLVFRPTDMSDVYSISLELKRIAGDPENWETLNRRFLKSLRRQFLIWRTLSLDEKQSYLMAV